MAIENISDALESERISLPPAISEWNGKDVQALPKSRAWLVLQIPIQTPNPLPNLSQKITGVNSKALPTVEEVLSRHGLEFNSPWNDRDVKQLPTSDHAWIVIPLQSSNQLASLQERALQIDTNDYRNVERVLERNGFPTTQFPPYFLNSTLV